MLGISKNVEKQQITTMGDENRNKQITVAITVE